MRRANQGDGNSKIPIETAIVKLELWAFKKKFSKQLDMRTVHSQCVNMVGMTHYHACFPVPDYPLLLFGIPRLIRSIQCTLSNLTGRGKCASWISRW